MPIERSGRIYYRTREACREAGISRATLFRWMKEGVIADAGLRDQNGWRLFTAAEITVMRGRIDSERKKPLRQAKRKEDREETL